MDMLFRKMYWAYLKFEGRHSSQRPFSLPAGKIIGAYRVFPKSAARGSEAKSKQNYSILLSPLSFGGFTRPI